MYIRSSYNGFVDNNIICNLTIGIANYTILMNLPLCMTCVYICTSCMLLRTLQECIISLSKYASTKLHTHILIKINASVTCYIHMYIGKP